MRKIPDAFKDTLWNYVPVSYLMIILAAEAGILFLATFYLDQIVTRSYGIPKLASFPISVIISNPTGTPGIFDQEPTAQW